MWISRALLLAGLMPTAGLAQGPMSAIDWLSESVSPAEIAILTEDPIASGVTTDEITVMPLDAVRLDGLGVLPSAVTGLPRSLWSRSDRDELIALIRSQPIDALPAIQDMIVTLLLAELDPPEARGEDGQLLLARIDTLLSMGALDQAAALLDEVSQKNDALLRRMFDVALLTGQEERACAALRASPGVTLTPSVQVFCLARSGDWNAAQLTLDTAAALGSLSKAETALLERFLNPEQDHDAALDPLPDPVTPLAFRIFEAIGEPLPTSNLPLAFARSDLRSLSGWKARIEAAERLARVRAIPAELLFSIYSEGRPAASGGVWERVRAVQDLDTAMRARNATDVAAALAPASAAMQLAGLDVSLAEYAAPLLKDLPLPGQSGRLAFRLELLAPDPEAAVQARAHSAPEDQFLSGIATGNTTSAQNLAPLEAAVALGFSRTPVSGDLADLVNAGKLGEAMLRAANLISAGAESDPGDIATALRLFRSIGLERVARAAGLQLILMSRPV